jgi:hypothetical protein
MRRLCGCLGFICAKQTATRQDSALDGVDAGLRDPVVAFLLKRSMTTRIRTKPQNGIDRRLSDAHEHKYKVNEESHLTPNAISTTSPEVNLLDKIIS